MRTREVDQVKPSGSEAFDVEFTQDSYDDDPVFGVGDNTGTGTTYDVDIPTSRTFEALFDGLSD